MRNDRLQSIYNWKKNQNIKLNIACSKYNSPVLFAATTQKQTEIDLWHDRHENYHGHLLQTISHFPQEHTSRFELANFKHKTWHFLNVHLRPNQYSPNVFSVLLAAVAVTTALGQVSLSTIDTAWERSLSIPSPLFSHRTESSAKLSKKIH